MNFGEKLKELRKEKNMTAQTMAKILGITRSAYSNYEQNIRQPSYEILTKIAVIFEVSTDYLLDVEEFTYNFEYQHDNTKLIHKEKNKK